MAFSFSAIYQSKTAHTVAVFASGNMVAMLLGVVGSLVQARYIAPEDMGIFRTFGIVAGYLTFLHLGVFDGLQREIPLQLGSGNQAKAEQAASACLAWIRLISIASAGLFLGLALRSAYYHEWMLFWGWLANVPVIVVTFYGGYLGTTFRTGQQFVRFSNASVLQAVAGTIVLPLLPIMGYYGACLRTAVGAITNLLVLHRWRPLKVRPRFSWSDFLEVIRIGLPLSGIGYIATSLWLSVEGTLVLHWFGLKGFGLYSMALFVRVVITQLASSLSQVMTVRIFEQYGRSNRVDDCLRVIVKPLSFAFLASIPLTVVGWFCLPFAMRLLVPQYVEATLTAQVMLLMLPITFLKMPYAIPWAMGRRRDSFWPVAGGFLAFIGCSWVFRTLGMGIASMAVAYLLGMLLNASGYGVLIWRLHRQERQADFSLATNENSSFT